MFQVAIGSLDGSPFPDGSRAFFEAYQSVLSTALGHAMRIGARFRDRPGEALIREFQSLPLELTLTCMKPGGVHCGDRNKCQVRRAAFARAGVVDRMRWPV